VGAQNTTREGSLCVCVCGSNRGGEKGGWVPRQNEDTTTARDLTTNKEQRNVI